MSISQRDLKKRYLCRRPGRFCGKSPGSGHLRAFVAAVLHDLAADQRGRLAR
jgi:hypothetical protein